WSTSKTPSYTKSVSWQHHREHFISREIMRATVFNYIECDYNRWRRHSWCGGLSPEQFENQNLA
ncbi:IS3 family transposase, partial [Escherichia coli]|uniref:IS3 family transposase n=1 Tax=Escherichia coli TaxID=562 RepID=UPI0011E3C350